MNKWLFTLVFFSSLALSNAQSEKQLIEATLYNYIEGTSYNYVDRINEAFYPEANLYLENKDKELWVVPIAKYSSWFVGNEKGKFNGRIGHIISIDQFQSIATAKVEILIPEIEARFIDMFLLKRLKGGWKIMSKSASKEKSINAGNRILFVTSNAHFYGDTDLKTGNSFSEIVIAYETFKEAGFTIDFVSPNGGSIPIGYLNTSDDLHKKYIYDFDFMYGLKHTHKPTDLEAKNYKAVYYVGGGSALFGVPQNKELHDLSMSIYEDQNGIISSVCHGTAGIAYLKTKDGKYLVDGKNVNGYPDAYENTEKDYYKTFPFRITQTIEAHGGVFKYSPREADHVEVDGNLVTGQNYNSTRSVALKVIELINLCCQTK